MLGSEKTKVKQRFFYCPKCGGNLKYKQYRERPRLVCLKCSYVFYENPAVGVAAIVLNEDKQILLGRRCATLVDVSPQASDVRRKKQTNSLTIPTADDERPTALNKGLWCIPCGYVEYDEDVYQAVIREFKEETNLDIVLKGVFTVQSNFHNPELHTVGIWFMAEVTGGELQAGDDLDQLAYYNLTDPPPLAFPTDKVVLDMLAKALIHRF
jgi:ADP-ribose pyrophosphatase YjhB (NUDIX family)